MRYPENRAARRNANQPLKLVYEQIEYQGQSYENMATKG